MMNNIQAAHKKAFTVAGILSPSALKPIATVLNAVLQKGDNFSCFQAQLNNLGETHETFA